jgi:hypothetical protein
MITRGSFSDGVMITAIMAMIFFSPRCTESRWYRVMTGESVYPISTLTDEQWVEKDKQDTSYIHICGRLPCKTLQK